MMRSHLNNIWTTSLVTHLLVTIPIISCFTALYNPSDVGISILDNSNFTSHLSQKEHGFWIEFYNSWCGHCIRFAPVWKEFAKDIQEWHSVVELAVVDCAEDRNRDICREMEIYMYPSIRYFWPNYTAIRDFSQPKPEGSDNKLTPEQKGYQYEGDLDNPIPLRKGLIDALTKSWGTSGVPKSWPDLNAFSVISKTQLIRMLPLSHNVPILIIIEKSNSYVGREVILDFCGHRDQLMVVRVEDTNQPLLNELLPHESDRNRLPLLTEVNRDNYNLEIICCMNASEDYRKSFGEVIRSKYLTSLRRGKSSVEADVTLGMAPVHDLSSKPMLRPVVEVNSPVHMVDLYNSLRYTIYNQITFHKRLNSSQLIIFKNFLSIIQKYFPFDDDASAGFIKLLSKWASTKNHYLDSDEISKVMSKFEDEYSLPQMSGWKSCLGSEPKYRGYPCSLWTLFHTLTVNEYLHRKDKINPLIPDGREEERHEVLPLMKEYIINFFGCTECAQNFRKETSGMEGFLTHGNSSILWLWKTHNKVNKRLAGDETEDPLHPKIQFPSKGFCPNCYTQDGSIFNESEVFNFLVDYYHPNSIFKDEERAPRPRLKDLRPVDSGLESHKGSNENNNRVIIIGSGSEVEFDHDHKHSGDDSVTNSHHQRLISTYYSLLNRTDISLCVVLYLFSAGLIIALFLYMKSKRRGKKVSYNKIVNINIRYFP